MAYAAYKHDRWWLPEIEDYQWDIVTSALDGSDRRRLTKSGGSSLRPSWSPYGSRIAFMSGSGVLYIMDSDGSDVRVVAPGFHTIRSAFVWSPDGRRLAFAARGNLLFVKDELYTVRADGTGLTKLGNTAGTPSWSPDGRRIAFARIDGNTHVAIVATDPDGANEKTVFESSEVRHSGVIDVSWSPDGTRIAIKDPLIRGGTSSQGRVTISVVDADGSGPPRLIALTSGGGSRGLRTAPASPSQCWMLTLPAPRSRRWPPSSCQGRTSIGIGGTREREAGMRLRSPRRPGADPAAYPGADADNHIEPDT